MAIGESLVHGMLAALIVGAGLYPFVPASWAFGVVAGLAIYGHMREVE